MKYARNCLISLRIRRKLFPNIDVEYIRYPDDTDFGRYFAKMTDALQRVRTPVCDARRQ